MGTKVILFCDNSQICKSARQFLKFHKIDFEDIGVGTDDGYAEFRRITHDNKIPPPSGSKKAIPST